MTIYPKTKPMNLKCAGLLVLLLSALIISCSSSSADYCSISGTVTAGGQPLQGATVTITGPETRTTTTDANGNYRFGNVENEDYTVTPTMSGFVFYPAYRPAYINGIDAVGFNFSAASLFHVAAKTHTIFQKLDGSIYSWGDNTNGQLGFDTVLPFRETPALVTTISGVKNIAAGNQFSVALLNDSTVRAWGNNDRGQLGNGSTAASYDPVQVVTASGALSGITAVAAGDDFAIALKSDGTVWAWGHNDLGQLGNGSLTDSPFAVQVSGLGAGVTAISAGYNHSLVIDTDSAIWAWGSNSNGQIGTGADPTSTAYYNTAAKIGIGEVISIAAGNRFSIAVRKERLDSIVYSWGINYSGQLALGNTTQYNNPQKIGNLTGTMTVAAGFDHALAVKTDGSVWAWGSNDRGQLGSAAGAPSLSPVIVSGISRVLAVSAGVKDSIALALDNNVWAWGANGLGQVGDGTTVDKTSPTLISIP